MPELVAAIEVVEVPTLVLPTLQVGIVQPILESPVFSHSLSLVLVLL